jgi:hypothetical protein
MNYTLTVITDPTDDVRFILKFTTDIGEKFYYWNPEKHTLSWEGVTFRRILDLNQAKSLAGQDMKRSAYRIHKSLCKDFK